MTRKGLLLERIAMPASLFRLIERQARWLQHNRTLSTLVSEAEDRFDLDQIRHALRLFASPRWVMSATSPIDRYCCKNRKSISSKNLAKVDFGLFRCCVAFQLHWGGPWSILDQTMWSLILPRAKRISSPENFGRHPKKSFATLSLTADALSRWAAAGVITG
jgi:hypothetical protein